jgi:hypothetical protein
MPDVEFIICQEKKLTKDEYHKLLGESMMVFSANLQETLGISAMEGVLVGAMPLLPNRLSYVEMYLRAFKYESDWTASFDDYLKHKSQLIETIGEMLDNYEAYIPFIEKQEKILLEKFLHPGPMLDRLLK